MRAKRCFEIWTEKVLTVYCFSDVCEGKIRKNGNTSYLFETLTLNEEYNHMSPTDYSNFQYLTERDCKRLVERVCEIIYMVYQLDWSRHVCMDGKFLKGEKLEEFYYEKFPCTNVELDLWKNSLNLEHEVVCGKILDKNNLNSEQSTEIMENGIFSKGENRKWCEWFAHCTYKD